MMTRLVVLADGDNTTWCGDAVIIDVPNDVYEAVADDGDSKLLRPYADKGISAKNTLFTLECIAEILYPDGINEPDDEWDPELADKVHEILKEGGFTPKEKAGG